jgi:ABC-type glycerol-3-phosphate transport system substrate-binding protein
MKQKRAILLLGLIIILSGWWITRGNSRVQPEAGVLDVWATWGEDPEWLQAFFERYSQSSDVPVRVTTQVRSDVLKEALTAADQPDLVILSNADLVKSYDQQGLIEPLDGWIELTGIDLEDFYPAPLKLCQSPDGGYLCLPWGADVEALFWNKDLFKAARLDPERSHTVVIQGPVVIIPAGAVDKEAAAQLLAWMTSPEILAEAAYAHSFLPTSRTAAQDARFQQIPNFAVFMDLLANTESRNVLTTAVREDLNQALGRIEEALRR